MKETRLNKIDSLFDGTTIINFSFYLQLLRRYRKSVVVVCVMTVLAAGAVYSFQQETYTASIDFSDVSSSSADPALKALSAFLNDDKKANKSNEILNLRTSMDFTKKLSSSLMENPLFSKLRFDSSFFGDRRDTVKAIIKWCKNNKECIDKKLIAKLPQFYEITDRDRGGVNFSVQVKATDELTANTLLSEIMKTIQVQRVESIKTNISQQEKVNIEILEKKKKELEAVDYFNMLEEGNKLNNYLKEIDTNIEYQAKLISETQLSLASAESKFRRSKKISKKRVSRDDLELEKKSNDLKERIEKLSGDIHLLENSSGNLTEKEKNIIENLKLELKRNKGQFQSLGVGNSSIAYDKFVKINEEKVGATELDFGVLTDQMNNAKESLNKLSSEKSGLLEKKNKIDQQLEQFKPSIDFVRSLGAKIEQLRLLRTTSVSDMRFDTYETPPDPDGINKIGKVLMIAYCLVSMVILNIVLLSVKYLFDDRIFDDKDLKVISEDLKVIGIGSYYE